MIKEQILKIAGEIGGNVKEKDGVITAEAKIAERKAFLSSKKLTYTFKVRINEEERKIKFSEYLKESSSGLSSGDSDLSSGFGFTKTSFNTLDGTRSGTIEEDSKLFGKRYEYEFDYSKVRKQVEELAQNNGYLFEYHVSPLGL